MEGRVIFRIFRFPEDGKDFVQPVPWYVTTSDPLLKEVLLRSKLRVDTFACRVLK